MEACEQDRVRHGYGRQALAGQRRPCRTASPLNLGRASPEDTKGSRFERPKGARIHELEEARCVHLHGREIGRDASSLGVFLHASDDAATRNTSDRMWTSTVLGSPAKSEPQTLVIS